jgi:AbiV family abortive infection protein
MAIKKEVNEKLITDKLWKEMIEEITIGRIPRLLDCAERLLLAEGHESVCAGLYTYAIEEYGKLLLLKQYKSINGNVKIEYKKLFRKHELKFKIALEKLPKECTTLRKGVFNGDIFDKDIFDVNQTADWEARLTAFYCDFTDSADSIKSVPTVDKGLLQDAIRQFKIFMNNLHSD